MIQRSRAIQPTAARSPATTATTSHARCRIVTLPRRGRPVDLTASNLPTRASSSYRRSDLYQPNRPFESRSHRHSDCSCPELRAVARRYDTAHPSVSDFISHPAKQLKRYAAAVLAVGVALACTMLALPLTERPQVFLLLAAVVLSAWYGGAGPGLLATGLSGLGQTAFFERPYGDDLIRTLLFLVVAAGI